MANRDQSRGQDRSQNWGQRGRRGQHDRWERDNEHHRSEHDRPWEHRSFGQEGGDPWRSEGRYGARYDEDRVGYGGQEYGVEGGRGHAMGGREPRQGSGRDERETWRAEGGPYGDLELNPRNRGIQEFGPPADYAYHPQAGHEFDPDYLHWREEQMRGHDRDYHEWRRAQQQTYDDDYRRFRSERREHFGRTFSDWRNQRSAVGGVADTGVAPGVGGYGDKVGMPSGYDARQSDKPSGMLDPSGPSGGAGSSSGGGGAPSGDRSPEFGKAPAQVQAASEGWDTRQAPQDRLADKAGDKEHERGREGDADEAKKR